MLLSELEYRVAICEPLHYKHEPTYLEAARHAAAAVGWKERRLGEGVFDSLVRHMREAIGIRNDYYRVRINDWRVVHG